MAFDKKAYREKVAAIGDTKAADAARVAKVKAAKAEAGETEDKTTRKAAK